MFRYLFSYVPPDPPPEVPKDEPPDPNANRTLGSGYRAARRTLVAICGFSLAWATAQFGLAEFRFDAAGVTVDLSNASLPVLLGAATVYMTLRCGMEYAMMERHVRRWRLAVLDLQGVSFLSRFTLVVLAAGALERSFRSVLVILVGLALMAVLAIAITAVLTAVFMPIRMRARKKAKRESAANAVSEAMVWGEMFAAVLSVLWMISFAVASYKLDQLRAFVWPIPPNPFALAIFVAVTIMTFLSHWLLRPVQRRLFAQRPGYYTERVEGGLRITFVDEKEEPLL